jgi:hypothetical protein
VIIIENKENLQSLYNELTKLITIYDKSEPLMLFYAQIIDSLKGTVRKMEQKNVKKGKVVFEKKSIWIVLFLLLPLLITIAYGYRFPRGGTLAFFLFKRRIRRKLNAILSICYLYQNYQINPESQEITNKIIEDIIIRTRDTSGTQEIT